MTPKWIGIDEPDEPNKGEPSPEIAIRITVPEDYLGVCIGALQARDGLVTAMEHLGGSQMILAFLPGSEFDGLSAAITESTQGRGKVERDLPPDISPDSP